MINFDEHGNLSVGLLFSLSIKEFREAFIESFPQHQVRQLIFGEFEKLIDSVCDFAGQPFYILVGGSFVTQKPEPADLDFVVVLPQRL